MISRLIQNKAATFIKEFKALAITGPRQSGKTTLAQKTFPKKTYVTLEDPDVRDFALSDPRAFLAQFKEGAILDEVQRVPHLFSYLQGLLDQSQKCGQYILTGSQQFSLNAGITQSLAGRIAHIHLLPLAEFELGSASQGSPSVWDAVFKGGYPSLFQAPVSPVHWLNAYIETYIERDVQQLKQIHDRTQFRQFVRLCAGSVGQLVSQNRLGADCGIDQKTAAAWLSVLEAGFIAFRLNPYHTNFRKRLIKTPKLYFYDTGLACRLLGIRSTEELSGHPLRGALFENWVLLEFMKKEYACDSGRQFYFWRDQSGLEVDFLSEDSDGFDLIECKSGQTQATDWFATLNAWVKTTKSAPRSCHLVYGGTDVLTRQGVQVRGWQTCSKIIS